MSNRSVASLFLFYCFTVSYWSSILCRIFLQFCLINFAFFISLFHLLRSSIFCFVFLFRSAPFHSSKLFHWFSVIPPFISFHSSILFHFTLPFISVSPLSFLFTPSILPSNLSLSTLSACQCPPPLSSVRSSTNLLPFHTLTYSPFKPTTHDPGAWMTHTHSTHCSPTPKVFLNPLYTKLSSFITLLQAR